MFRLTRPTTRRLLDQPTSSRKSTAAATICLHPTSRPTTRFPASRPFTNTRLTPSNPQAELTTCYSHKTTASTPPSRTTDFVYLSRRHITPARRPTLDIANRPTTCGSCKSTASDRFSSTTRTFSSASRPDDTLSRKPTAHDLDSRLRFYKPNRRHVIPQADRLCAPLSIRGRPTSTFYSTSRPTLNTANRLTTSSSCKSTVDNRYSSTTRTFSSTSRTDDTLSRKPTASATC